MVKTIRKNNLELHNNLYILQSNSALSFTAKFKQTDIYLNDFNGISTCIGLFLSRG